MLRTRARSLLAALSWLRFEPERLDALRVRTTLVIRTLGDAMPASGSVSHTLQGDESDSGEDVHDLTAWYQRRDTVLLDDIGMEAAIAWVASDMMISRSTG